MIVSGLPRSGTSLLMSMLAAGGIPPFTDRRREPDESNPRGYWEFEDVKRLKAGADSPWLGLLDDHAVKIVIPLIRRLPADFAADVLLLERDLGEVLASQVAMLARRGLPTADPAVLRPAFEREVELTHRWLAESTGCRWLTLSHRRLIGDPSGSAREIAVFLKRPLDEAAMAAEVDPALHRQRG